MSRDLFYYLSLKRYITVNHSGQNHIRGKKTTAMAFSLYQLYGISPPHSQFLLNPMKHLYQVMWPMLSTLNKFEGVLVNH